MKCWLNPEELSRLERAAGDGWSWEREVAMLLMGRCGLRADEVNYPGPGSLRWAEDGDCWLFEVRGKNTEGGGSKVRDVRMPDDVQDDIHKFAREHGIQILDEDGVVTYSWVADDSTNEPDYDDLIEAVEAA